MEFDNFLTQKCSILSFIVRQVVYNGLKQNIFINKTATETGPEVIKLEFNLKLKIKRNFRLLADPMIVLYFEFEKE